MAAVNSSANSPPLLPGINDSSQEMSEAAKPPAVVPATNTQQSNNSATVEADIQNNQASTRPNVAAPVPSTTPLATDNIQDNLRPYDHSLPPTPGGSQHGAATPPYPALTPSTSMQQLNAKPPAGNGGGNNTAAEPAKKKGNVFLRLGKVWMPELIAALLVITLLVAEILILAHYDGKYLDRHWPHSWKINAVFAFITTFLEAACMFYVGAALGQLRWHWFKTKEHRLKWLDIMTNARAPTGALRFLMTKGMLRQYAAVGALIVLLLLGVSTFTQNVITEITFPRFMGNDTGLIPINTNYTWFDKGTTIDVGDQAPIPQMIAAMQAGFYSFSNGETVPTVAGASWCKGDACHFGNYDTLGVCGKCEQFRPDAVHNPCQDRDCTSDDYYTLTEGDSDLSLVALNGVLNLTSDTKHPVGEPISRQTGPLIARMMAMIANGAAYDKKGAGATAVECAAWWCVQRYSAKIVNGTLRENLEHKWTDTSRNARTKYLQNEQVTLRPPNCVINGSKPTNASYCTFNAGAFTQAAIQNFLTGGNFSNRHNPFLSGSVVHSGLGKNETWNSTTLLAGAMASYSLTKQSFENKVWTGWETMTKYMTTSIRETISADNTWEYTYGYATNEEQKFHVRWGWIAYPVVVVVLSLVFLLVTMWVTRDDEPWKSSVLSLMFHAFSDKDREHFGDVNTAEEMEELIRTQKVRLVKEAGKEHLLFQSGTVATDHERRDWAGEQGARLGSHGAQAVVEFLDAGDFNLR